MATPEIKFLLIAIVDTDTNEQYTSGPNKYNMTLGFETREQAEKELKESNSFYIGSSKYERRDAMIVELVELLTDYNCLYNGYEYRKDR